MRIIFFFDDTRIRISEGHQDYTRTGSYVCTRRPQYVTAAVVYLPVLLIHFFTKNKYNFFHECGTVVPSQGFLSLREVWRHTEVGYVRNCTLEGQQRGNTSESASRSQDDLEVL